MMFGIDAGIISLIQSILLIISALLIIIATVGVLKIDRNLDNVVYARIHILGIVDIAGIIAFIAIGQPLFALIYLFLAPLLAHALANAYFHGEDTLNNPVLNPSLEEISDEEAEIAEEEVPVEESEMAEEVPEDDLDESDDSSDELEEERQTLHSSCFLPGVNSPALVSITHCQLWLPTLILSPQEHSFQCWLSLLFQPP